MRKKPTVLFMLVLLLLLVGAVGVSWHSQQKQYLRNRQLIAALLRNDDQQALALVNEGADPNTPYTPTPMPSLLERIKQLFHHTPPPENNSPSAFLIVCGAYDYSVHTPAKEALDEAQTNRSENAPLVQAMLAHGANANAHSSALESKATALMWAACANRSNTAEVLLQHGADVNAKDVNGITPLMNAVGVARPDVVRLLLQHGADVNAQDQYGYTALIYAVLGSPNNDVATIRQLLASGANPNLADYAGDTPLKIAQSIKRSDIIALLKHAGATK